VVQENELLTLLIAVGVLVFIATGGARIRKLPQWRWCLTAYLVMTVGWTLTVLEGLFWGDTLNLLEHICYTISSITLAIWVGRVFLGGQRWQKA